MRRPRTPGSGSSPLARGLLAEDRGSLRRRRIIPARAGFTEHRLIRAQEQQDHPRSRGVYMLNSAGSYPASGSSPLARGLPKAAASRAAGMGIIPARAGFTTVRTSPQCQMPDHPRSRGVYPLTPATTAEEVGSSPLARGLRHARQWIRRLPGIIPARAGFTPRRHQNYPTGSDHPRSRGVYASSPASHALARGSSPLARGLPADTKAHVDSPRIIPARAGFTILGDDILRGIDGSSPLARGLLPVSGGEAWRFRIIPARAGFTAGRRRPGAPVRDHPRSRGVYHGVEGGRVAGAGSSPLARGLHCCPIC